MVEEVLLLLRVVKSPPLLRRCAAMPSTWLTLMACNALLVFWVLQIAFSKHERLLCRSTVKGWSATCVILALLWVRASETLKSMAALRLTVRLMSLYALTCPTGACAVPAVPSFVSGVGLGALRQL